MCEQLGSPCVIDLSLDMRRRTALQRTIEESRAFQEMLENVIAVLRGKDTHISTETLIHQVQRTSDSENVYETLQAIFQLTRESGSRSSDRQIKEEANETSPFISEADETERLSSSNVASEFPRKRKISEHNANRPRSFVNFIQHGSEGEEESESLASRYLPLIYKLRIVSDFEASRILHDFKISPIETEGVAALNLFESLPSKIAVHSQKDQHSFINTGKRGSPDRTNWHPSLQITISEIQTPFTVSESQRPYEQWGRSGSSQVCLPPDRFVPTCSTSNNHCTTFPRAV